MNSKSYNRAFSLVELSMVITIIAVIIAGVVAGSIFVEKSRQSVAVSLTGSAPMHSMRSTSLWLESGLESSFGDVNVDDGLSLSDWVDGSSNGLSISVGGSGSDVTYSNSINDVPAVKFSGGKYFTVDGSFLNGSDYSVVVLESRDSGKSGNYFIGDVSNDTSNETLVLGYSASGTVIHSQGEDNSYDSSVASYASSSGVPRVFVFTHSAVNGNKTYVDGYLVSSDAGFTDHLSNISTLDIGNSYEGEIGELAIFSKELRTSEVIDISSYLSKKWSVAIAYFEDNDTVIQACDGTVLAGGVCEQSCSVSVSGVTVTSVADGASGSFSCDGSNFEGSVSYTCSNGNLSTGGSCSCSDGYSLSEGSCVQACAVSIDGVSSTSVSSASGTVTCDEDNFEGSVSYTCSGGVLTPVGSCSCADGYSLVEGECVIAPCTGGTIDTDTVPGETIHVFTSNGTLSCPAGKTVQYFIVGGGGGSGGFGGGGGAGGVLTGSTSISADDYAIVVGAGGNGETGNDVGGTNGGNSSFNSLIAIGGGYGRHSYKGFKGGSGGGNGYCNGTGWPNCTSSPQASTGTSGQGNAGGLGVVADPGYPGGGGGGAGGPGGNASASNGGTGGNAGAGVQSSITGTAKWYGVGGPGGSRNGNHGSAATGGASIAEAGAANTGNGAGAGTTQWVGKNGGSGIVVIRY